MGPRLYNKEYGFFLSFSGVEATFDSHLLEQWMAMALDDDTHNVKIF